MRSTARLGKERKRRLKNDSQEAEKQGNGIKVLISREHKSGGTESQAGKILSLIAEVDGQR